MEQHKKLFQSCCARLLTNTQRAEINIGNAFSSEFFAISNERIEIYLHYVYISDEVNIHRAVTHYWTRIGEVNANEQECIHKHECTFTVVSLYIVTPRGKIMVHTIFSKSEQNKLKYSKKYLLKSYITNTKQSLLHTHIHAYHRCMFTNSIFDKKMTFRKIKNENYISNS